MTENKTAAGKPADDFIRIQDLWGLFLPRWRWFVLSIIVTMTAAMLYLMSTPSIYTRSAAILVKDDSKSGSSSSAASEFSDLGIFRSNTNINNELFTLKSPALMAEVVRRLGLNETYHVRQGLKNVGLYKANPVAVTYCQPMEESISFNIRIDSQNACTISDLMVSGVESKETYVGQMGDSIHTVAGTLLITPTQYYNNTHIGTSIRYAKNKVDATADSYLQALRVELGSKDATIINLTINDVSVRKAEDILNTLIQVYNEKWIQDKNQIAVSTSRFIGDRLSVIESELGHVDDNISSFKSEHLMPDVQAASSLYMAQSAENKKELLTLNTQLSTARYILKELKEKKLNQPLPTNSGIANTNIENQISEYNNMVLNRNRLIANSSEKNPLVKDLANSLQSMQRTIIQSVDNLIVSLNTQIRSIREQEVTTTSQLASNPSQAKYLLSVERQQKVKEELYLYLLQKREENELSQAFTAYNTRVITAPRGSMVPTSPQKMKILLIAFALGLVFPGGVIFLKEHMNTRVRGRKDLENMNVPFVGEIPMVDGNKKKAGKKTKENECAVVVKEKSRDVINEAFRVVRTNLEFMAQGNKVVMISSMNPGSGKTFITMNLAVSFAIKDKKVAVIDLDMRRASLSAYVNKPKTGVSNYLGGQVSDWKEIVVNNVVHANVGVIPVGTIPPNPSELLFSPKMETLIASLRKEYDLVFIDCPPVEIVADTSIIAKWAGMTLFVVRSGLMEREMLPVIDSYYADHKLNNMALLLNGTTVAYGGRYGYHRYGYRYGYHYGYGNYSNE